MFRCCSNMWWVLPNTAGSPSVSASFTACENDCIVMDQNGAVELNGLILWWLVGQCRGSRTAIVWCQDCGDKVLIEAGKIYRCNCGHRWAASQSGMTLRLSGSTELKLL